MKLYRKYRQWREWGFARKNALYLALKYLDIKLTRSE